MHYPDNYNEKFAIQLTGLGNTVPAKQLTTDQPPNNPMTPPDVHYLAPECFGKMQQQESEIYKSDIWAIGVITYVLLTGVFPFRGWQTTEIIDAIKTKHHAYQWFEHGRRNVVAVSRLCKQFVNGLLEKDPKQRFSAKEASKHAWLDLKDIDEEDTYSISYPTEEEKYGVEPIEQAWPKLLQKTKDRFYARMNNFETTGIST